MTKTTYCIDCGQPGTRRVCPPCSKAIRVLMAEKCKCGRLFGEHGSWPPHDRGEECKEFSAAAPGPGGAPGREPT